MVSYRLWSRFLIHTVLPGRPYLYKGTPRWNFFGDFFWPPIAFFLASRCFFFPKRGGEREHGTGNVSEGKGVRDMKPGAAEFRRKATGRSAAPVLV